MSVRGSVTHCRCCGRRVFSQKAKVPTQDKHGGRGLCGVCYYRLRGTDNLLDYPPVRRMRDDLLDDWLLLREEGHTWRQAAERLGMPYPSFERAMFRARKAGDGRALPPLETLRRVA